MNAKDLSPTALVELVKDLNDAGRVIRIETLLLADMFERIYMMWRARCACGREKRQIMATTTRQLGEWFHAAMIEHYKDMFSRVFLVWIQHEPESGPAKYELFPYHLELWLDVLPDTPERAGRFWFIDEDDLVADRGRPGIFTFCSPAHHLVLEGVQEIKAKV